MAMFGGKPQGSKAPPPAASAPAAPEPVKQERIDTPKASAPKRESHIAAGMAITGDMVGDGDVLIDGKFTGNLRCHAATIGKDGVLDGTIAAEDVIVHGTVNGDIQAKRVQLMPNAIMSGDVVHEILEVAAGAQVEGRYSRGDMKAMTRSVGAKLPEGAPPKDPQNKAAEKDTEQKAGQPAGTPVSSAATVGAESKEGSADSNSPKSSVGSGTVAH